MGDVTLVHESEDKLRGSVFEIKSLSICFHHVTVGFPPRFRMVATYLNGDETVDELAIVVTTKGVNELGVRVSYANECSRFYNSSGERKMNSPRQ